MSHWKEGDFSMKRYMSRASVVCLLFVLFTRWLVASPTGSITGVVKDPTGAFVPGAKVTTTNIATNIQLSTTTNEQGFYEFPQLAPAMYSLAIELPGFKRTVINELVQGDQITRPDVGLQVGDIVQEVQVQAVGARDLIHLNQRIDHCPFETR